MNASLAVYLDADGEYDAAEIPVLAEPIESGEADYVIGSRYRGRREEQKPTRLLGNLFFTGLLCVASGRFMTDGQSGFRAFSRRALDCAEIIHDYNYAQVLTLDLLKKGMRYKEVPISYQTRKSGRSFINLRYLWRVPTGMARQLLKA
jgi:glycosyltransferase involved in cell wall biosynthesis